MKIFLRTSISISKTVFKRSGIAGLLRFGLQGGGVSNFEGSGDKMTKNGISDCRWVAFGGSLPNFAFLSLVPLVMNLHAKFNVSNSNRSRDMEGVPKFLK